MWSPAILLVFFPGLAYSFQCYRCYGNSFCNGGISHPGFQNSTHTDRCETVISTYSGISPEMLKALNAVNQNLDVNQGNMATLNNTTDPRFGCLTATVHEARENHTLRMCINNATNFCQLLQNALFPNNGSNSEVGFSCRTCNSSLCNTFHLTALSNASSVAFSTILLVTALFFSYKS